MNTEQLIISSLVNIKEYKQKTLPHIKEEYFESLAAKTFFKIVQSYESKYKDVPTESAFEIELESVKNLTQETYEEVEKLKTKAYSEKVSLELKKASLDWLVDKTEEHCKQRSVYNAVLESVEIISGNTKKSQDVIPSMLQASLNVSFDSSVGHDFIRDWEARYELYHTKVNRIPFPLTMLNKTTKGGLPKKSIGVPISGTGVGKSMFLTYLSGYWLTQGYNVLFITLEMAYDKVCERIDAALFDISMDDLKKYPKEVFETKINKLKGQNLGRLIVKEYPTGTMSAANLLALLDELRTKEDFKPDVVCIDYLGLMKPVRGNGTENSYNSMKFITEEVRSVAMERDLLAVIPHQVNRQGQSSSDFDLTEIADSAGISMTADWIVGMMTTEELEKLGHMKFKQLKNRHGSLFPKSFIVGINRDKMQFYDVDTQIGADNPAPVNTLDRLKNTPNKNQLNFD